MTDRAQQTEQQQQRQALLELARLLAAQAVKDHLKQHKDKAA